jgi:hypothetical protein
MKTSRKFIAAGAIPLFALAAIFAIQSAQSPEIAPTPAEIFTWDCEYPTQKPEAITFTCADGNMYVDEITWSQWSADGARGTGTYNVNDCEPDCADGTMLRGPVTITLSNPTEYKNKFYLRTLVIRSDDGKNLPEMTSDRYEWDVMEFAERMGWDE